MKAFGCYSALDWDVRRATLKLVFVGTSDFIININVRQNGIALKFHA